MMQSIWYEKQCRWYESGESWFDKRKSLRKEVKSRNWFLGLPLIYAPKWYITHVGHAVRKLSE